MKHIVCAGQIPPPIHGQALAIENLLGGQYSRIQLHHVDMKFSRDIEDIGKFSLRKILHLALLIIRIIVARFRYKASTLYYPPTGVDGVSLYRDIAILSLCRPFYQETVFHFHAGGISKVYENATGLKRRLMSKAYCAADLAIELSSFNPPDGRALGALRTVVLPYGIADAAGATNAHSRHGPLKLLYVGHLGESKGVLDLLQACKLLLDSNVDFQLDLLGRAQPPAFEGVVRARLAKLGLEQRVCLRGVCMGEEKWHYYRNADVFCFPSFYEMETFGIVVLEAMQFSVPVVGTRWRGIQDIIVDGETGYLVGINQPGEIARSIALLANDEALRVRMGANARRAFLERYSLKQWAEDMEDLLCPRV